MTRLQMREWTILLAALFLVATGNSATVVAQEGNDPFGEGKPRRQARRTITRLEQASRRRQSRPTTPRWRWPFARRSAMPTNMEFIETPLQEAVDYLKDLHSIEIQLDSKTLEEAGSGRDTPVTGTLNRISLDSALRLLLSNHDLTFVVDKGVLLITTPAAAADMIEIRVYDVEDLLAQGGVNELSEILRLCSIRSQFS